MLGMIVVSCAISVGLVIAFSAIARSRRGTGGVFWLSLLPIVPACMCFSPAIALQSLLTFVGASFCLTIRATPRTVTWTVIGAMVVSHGIVVWLALPRLQELSRLRKEFPFE